MIRLGVKWFRASAILVVQQATPGWTEILIGDRWITVNVEAEEVVDRIKEALT